MLRTYGLESFAFSVRYTEVQGASVLHSSSLDALSKGTLHCSLLFGRKAVAKLRIRAAAQAVFGCSSSAQRALGLLLLRRRGCRVAALCVVLSVVLSVGAFFVEKRRPERRLELRSVRFAPLILRVAWPMADGPARGQVRRCERVNEQAAPTGHKCMQGFSATLGTDGLEKTFLRRFEPVARPAHWRPRGLAQNLRRERRAALEADLLVHVLAPPHVVQELGREIPLQLAAALGW